MSLQISKVDFTWNDIKIVDTVVYKHIIVIILSFVFVEPMMTKEICILKVQ